MAGRPRKPVALKKLTGTAQPCRVSDEPQYERVVKIPPAPKYMNKHAKKAYRTTTEQMNRLGLLNEVNIPIVVMYANELGLYWEAQERLNSEGRYDTVMDKLGNTKERRKDLDKAASQYFENIKKMATELGLTPASAHKVKMPERKRTNPLGDF